MKPAAKKPKKHPGLGQVRADLLRLERTWRRWRDAGMPRLSPVSRAELTRRINLLGAALDHLSK